eukprot:scaffold259326_cov27-Tisochrysis_lutea.AAC.3
MARLAVSSNVAARASNRPRLGAAIAVSSVSCTPSASAMSERKRREYAAAHSAELAAARKLKLSAAAAPALRACHLSACSGPSRMESASRSSSGSIVSDSIPVLFAR